MILLNTSFICEQDPALSWFHHMEVGEAMRTTQEGMPVMNPFFPDSPLTIRKVGTAYKTGYDDINEMVVYDQKIFIELSSVQFWDILDRLI